MNITQRWECQECFRLFKIESDAISCHPPKQIFICGHCDGQYDSRSLAEACGLEGAGSTRIDIESIKRMRIDDQ